MSEETTDPENRSLASWLLWDDSPAGGRSKPVDSRNRRRNSTRPKRGRAPPALHGFFKYDPETTFAAPGLDVGSVQKKHHPKKSSNPPRFHPSVQAPPRKNG